jgi:hypothetical protein
MNTIREKKNLLTALRLADKPVFSQTVTIVLSMYLYCNNTTHFNIFSLSSTSLTVRNGGNSHFKNVNTENFIYDYITDKCSVYTFDEAKSRKI